MNKYFIFASDKRAYLDTVNVVKELKSRNLKYFYLFSEELSTQYPHQGLNSFSYDTNIEFSNKSEFYKSININLPFKPDIVILTCESWQPQQSIIAEFKQKGSIISCIENSVWVVGTIKSRLEIISRFKYPTNCIDIFFENSQWSLDTKKICGWYDFKSVMVGNPKYDHITQKSTDQDNILVFGTMEKEAKLKIYKILNNLIQTKYKIYYRPHPGEISTNPNLKIKGVEVILNESKIPEIASKCDYHLGNLGASTYYSIIFDKTFISTDNDVRLEDLDIDFFKGNEFNFWAPIINVNSWEEFTSKIGVERIEILKSRLATLKENIILYDENLEFLKMPKSPLDYKLFDNFNDRKASNRIVNYLEQL